MPETISDAVLSAAQAGDIAALNQLICFHRQGVYRYGLHVCRTTEDAEDAVQETLWAATRAIRTFRGTASSIVSWLFTIVRRECLRLVERHRRAPVALGGAEDTFIAEIVDPADAVALQRRIDLLAAAFADLDPLHREVILLRDIREQSAPEAAETLGISIDALKSRLHRARANLRDRVRRRAVGSDLHASARAMAIRRPGPEVATRMSMCERPAPESLEVDQLAVAADVVERELDGDRVERDRERA